MSKSGAWTTSQSVDEFGDVTEDGPAYLSSFFSGTFSNTATTDGELEGSVSIVWCMDEKYQDDGFYLVQFSMLEYGDNPFTYTSSDAASSNTLKTKDGNGDKNDFTVSGSAPDGALGFIDGGLGGGDFIKSLSNESGDVRCILSFGNTTFDFTIESNGFAEAFGAYDKAVSDMMAKQKSDAADKLVSHNVSEALKNILPGQGDELNAGAMDYLEANFDSYRQLEEEEIRKLFPGTYCFIQFNNQWRTSVGSICTFEADTYRQIATLDWTGYDRTNRSDSEYRIEGNAISSPYPNCWVYEIADGYYLLWRNGAKGQTRNDTDIPDLLLMYACDEEGNPTTTVE